MSMNEYKRKNVESVGRENKDSSDMLFHTFSPIFDHKQLKCLKWSYIRINSINHKFSYEKN